MKTPQLLHYASSPINFESLAYEDDPDDYRKRPGKPIGLWVSIDDAWEKWCREENYNLEGLEFKHLVILKKEAKILVLDTSEKIFEFSESHCPLSTSPPSFNEELDTWKIDWMSLKKDYQGIIISPYQWECRTHPDTVWYYGWDCASGCIWDLNCIESFTLVENGPEAA